MGGKVNYYLVKDDYVKISNNVENEINIKYVRTGNYLNKEDIKIYNSLTEYEYLGINRKGNQSENFIVIPKEDELVVEEGYRSNGDKYYSVYPRGNENSIVFNHSGLYTNENDLWQRREEKYQRSCVVPGYIYTAYKGIMAKKIYKTFSKYIKAQCKIKYNGFCVGDEAFKYYGTIDFVRSCVEEHKDSAWKTEEDSKKMFDLNNNENSKIEKKEKVVPKFIEHTIKNKRLNKTNFFYLIEKQDFSRPYNEDAVVRPIIEYLSECDDIVIFAFDDKLSELLFELDTKKIADNMKGFTSDNFLYARCLAVINGGKFYNDVLDGKISLDSEELFECILYVAQDAWAEKYKKDVEEYPHTPKKNYETYSNKKGWE